MQKMSYFLAKTEPREYSIDDLERLGTDKWNGVSNPVAVKNLRSMKLGDKVFIYHSGKNPSIVGLAEVVKEAVPDPNNPRSWVPEVKFEKKFTNIVSLEEIKTSHLFDDWALVRQGRLSVMAVPEKFLSWFGQKNNP
jgi:predicted RNA-binding protein with PUA-like domain